MDSTEAFYGLRLILGAVALAFLGLLWMEGLLARRSAGYARLLALRRLRAHRELLAPTRVDPSAEGKATYRAAPETPFVDVARFPALAPLADEGTLRHYAGRTEWLAERRRVVARRAEHHRVWIVLRQTGETLHLEARAFTSVLALAWPFLLACALALFTTASLAIVVGSLPLSIGISLLAWSARRGEEERLAEDALEEIEDALAAMDGQRG